MTAATDPQTPKSYRTLAFGILKLLIVLASLVWVLYLLQDAWGEVERAALEIKPLPLIWGLLLGLMATWLGFESFALLFKDSRTRAITKRTLAHFYFAGQLMKHLPGRFFGVIYQIASTRGRISTTHWLATNAAHMVFTMASGLVLACLIIVVAQKIWWMTAPILAAIIIMLSLWRLPFVTWALRALERFPTRITRKLADTLIYYKETFASRHAAFIGVLALSWLIYFLSWGLYAGSLPDLSFGEGIHLSALYVVAWIIGYLSFVTPSGLGVRELAFTVIAFQYSPELIAFGLILGRVSLLSIDIILGLTFLRIKDGPAQ